MLGGGGGYNTFVSDPFGNGDSTDITLEDCTLLGYARYDGVACKGNTGGTSYNWTLRRCRIFVAGGGIPVLLELPLHTADYDVGITIENCHLIGGFRGIYGDVRGSGSGKPGGLIVKNCTFDRPTNVGIGLVANWATSIPTRVHNCLFLGGGDQALAAGTSGQITEDYNAILGAATARSNVTAGSNSKVDAMALLVSLGQEAVVGARERPYLTPLAGSPLLGFGNDGTYTASDDLAGRPRPAGGGSTVKGIGALERHDTGARETTTVDAGSTALKVAGPGDQDLHVPVDATSTTLSIRARYDSNHAATNKPQVLLLANGEIGVAAQTLTMTAAVDTWETLTTSAFTPTAKGWVTLRLVSRSAAGNGIAFFDTVS